MMHRASPALLYLFLGWDVRKAPAGSCPDFNHGLPALPGAVPERSCGRKELKIVRRDR